MLNIFPRLFSLKKNLEKSPEEDFLTEILAFIFETDSEFFNSFLIKFNVIEKEDVLQNPIFKPQEYFNKIDLEDSNSRIDLVVYSDNHIIFLENKFESTEHSNQIGKYAKQLMNLSSKNKILIYLSKNYENMNEQMKKLDKSIKPIYIRWFEILRLLKDQSHKSIIIEQFILHLEYMGIQSDFRLNSLDISTMQNMQRIIVIMKNVIEGKVLKHFLKVIESTKAQQIKPEIQLRRENRYVYYHEGNGCHIVFGFILNPIPESDFPRVGFQVWRDPNSNDSQIIADLLINTKWQYYNLEKPKEWGCILQEKNIVEFLNTENHVENIENYLIECIDNFKLIKSDFDKYL